MNRIKELRQSKGLTQAELAQKVGISEQSVSFYENNRRKPKIETWNRLANFFNVSVPYLQNFNDPKKDYCKQKNNKIWFKDVFEKEHIVSIEEITQVTIDKIYLDIYEITLWNKFKLIGKYRITPVTMDVINEKLNKFFKRKKIIKPQKFEKTMLKFSEINGVVHEKPLDELKCLFVEIGELETKKFSVQFKNGAPFYIDKQTYNFFKNIFTKRRNKNERQENNI